MSHNPYLDEEVDLTLTRGQVLSLTRMVRRARKSKMQAAQRSTFVPAPGERDANLVIVQRHTELLARLLDAADVELDDLEGPRT